MVPTARSTHVFASSNLRASMAALAPLATTVAFLGARKITCVGVHVAESEVRNVVIGICLRQSREELLGGFSVAYVAREIAAALERVPVLGVLGEDSVR